MLHNAGRISFPIHPSSVQANLPEVFPSSCANDLRSLVAGIAFQFRRIRRNWRVLLVPRFVAANGSFLLSFLRLFVEMPTHRVPVGGFVASVVPKTNPGSLIEEVQDAKMAL